ncbi:MAG: type I DNA topoisomerase [Firmicutes bacterium]|nr:type I DNA topoisomerase [Bacillota bacterium]
MAAKNLIIVESPSKAKTIEKFLGSRYRVVATKGHLRDLPKSRLGVDIEDNFSPEYINVRGKGDTIREIKEAVKDSSKVFLATDPDREGEAITWHVCNLLGIDPLKADRITFQEITKPAVTEAVKHPRPVDMALVDAQQGRRVLDRVVGYKISPLLWAKVARGLSAGRVQSAALKIICDRESEIEAFIPKEYWSITGTFSKPGLTPGKEKKESFTARLEQYKGKKLTVSSAEENAKVRKDLDAGSYSVGSVEKKQVSRKPYAPYTTSVLQQDASVKLGFTPKKTMMLAQELYEGVAVKGHGTIGLITYIRTDSVRISDIADKACKDFIRDRYSDRYLGNNVYTNKKKGAQDAHEAIRPSYVELEPEEIKDSLSADQYKLYRLIWSRFVASRMKPALYDQVSADVVNGDYCFKAGGRKLVFDGYLRVYSDSDQEKDRMLPELEEGSALKLLDLESEQKFTEPPSRFTEASLIKELEDKGIGRPSTYAPIVTNLLDRRYIYREKKALAPTELGMRITREIMEVYFRELVDAGFTADMEEKLDKVEEGEESWQNVVSDYYHGYMEGQLRVAEKELDKIEMAPQLTGEMCPECGKPLAVKHGRFGDFLACTGFPGCRYTRTIVTGTGVMCPKCGKEIIEKRSRKGKLFYGCSGYPDCDQVYWYRPVDKKCPKCGSLLVIRGRSLQCSNAECGYHEKRTSEDK